MDEVRVNIGGAEMELRPVSARQYLAARMEAEKMTEDFGNDQISKAVLLGASLLSKGLFYDNERIFLNGSEVLDALSADEIVNTAVYMDIEPERKVMIVEAVEQVKKAGLMSDSQESVEIENYKIADSPNAVESGWKRTDTEHTVNSSKVNTGSREKSISPRSNMRRVSDFFQRDSRRYDGIISSY